MRLRVLALPTQTLGPASHTPFLLVLDRCTPAEGEDLAANAADIREATGAAGVMAFSDDVELDEIQLGAVDVDGLDLSRLNAALAGHAQESL